MKKLLFTVLLGAIVLLSGCGSKKELVLDSKHLEFPDYIKNAKAEVQEAYIMAAQYPEALASVPCYCGCYEQDGHISNLDCFVDGMDQNMAVTGWDTMGIA